MPSTAGAPAPCNTAAADWIADRLSALRLERILVDSASCDPTGSCGLSYNEPFVARPSPTGDDPAATALTKRSIVGVIPGTDPVLHLTTDVHDDYHRVSDDADFVSFGSVARVVTCAERLTRDIADRPGRLTFVPMVTAAPGRPPR